MSCSGTPVPASDRRSTRRHRVHGPIHFSIENWQRRSGRILDLCLEGCLIQHEHAADCMPGDTLDLRFEINRLAFRARCIVRRVSPDGRLGVQLTQLSQRSRTQLQQLLAELESPPGER